MVGIKLGKRGLAAIMNALRWIVQRDNSNERPSIRIALFFSAARQYTGFLITLPTIMILSRLLTPTQVGVYSIALAFINLVHMLRDFGTSGYLVQAPVLDRATVRSAFTITLIIAWALAAILFVASPLVAGLFRSDGVGSVLRILCIVYLLMPIGSTVLSMLARELMYGVIYKISVFERIVQSGVTIWLAWLGYGYYSPAWGAVAGRIANVLACFYWANEYRARGLSLQKWREISRFGVQKTGGSIMERLGESSPDFVIGRMIGLPDVAMFSRGFGLVRMFKENLSGTVKGVSYSTFAQLHRDGGNPGVFFMRSITYITGVGWLFLVFASLMAFPIIRIFFGNQWDGAVPILRLMAIQMCIQFAVLNYENLLTGIGRVGLATCLIAGWQLLFILTLVVAAFWGLTAMAAGLIPTTGVLVLVVVIILCRFTEVTARGYMKALWPSLGLIAAALFPAVLARLLYTPAADRLWGPLVVSGGLYCLGAAMGGYLTSHPVWIDTVRILRRHLLRRPSFDVTR